MSTYYVCEKYGDDNNPGTVSSPWRSEKYALSQAVGGDFIVMIDEPVRIPRPRPWSVGDVLFWLMAGIGIAGSIAVVVCMWLDMWSAQ